MTSEHEMPDWPPQGSAFNHPEGTRRYGSTGQLFQVRNRQWVRIVPPKIVPADGAAVSRPHERD